MTRYIRTVVALVLMLAAVCPAAAAPPTVEAYVIRIIEGDTLQVKIGGKFDRVRMIGVDAPDIEHKNKPAQYYGPEAERYTRVQLTNRTVFLELDVQHRDKTGQLLAYVWTVPPAAGDEADARANMFNALLLRDGCARLATGPPNVKYAECFKVCQQEAKDLSRGLWDLPLK